MVISIVSIRFLNVFHNSNRLFLFSYFHSIRSVFDKQNIRPMTIPHFPIFRISFFLYWLNEWNQSDLPKGGRISLTHSECPSPLSPSLLSSFTRYSLFFLPFSLPWGNWQCPLARSLHFTHSLTSCLTISPRFTHSLSLHLISRQSVHSRVLSLSTLSPSTVLSHSQQFQFKRGIPTPSSPFCDWHDARGIRQISMPMKSNQGGYGRQGDLSRTEWSSVEKGEKRLYGEWFWVKRWLHSNLIDQAYLMNFDRY